MYTIHEDILVKQLKKGSHKAFSALYDQYFDLLYGFIFSLIRSHEQTKEIVQETFIKVWVNHPKIDTNLSFKAWLYKIAKNHLLDQLKKQWNNVLFEDYLNYCEDEFLTVDSSNENFDYELFRLLYNKAKQKLSPRQAEVVELCKGQDLPAPLVAEKLNISEQAVYNYLSQAKIILKKEMKPFLSLIY